MKINKINQDKILKAIELVCPMLKENLIEEAYIVGSVAKGTARIDSDIDLILYNSNFKGSMISFDVDFDDEYILNVVEYLNNKTENMIRKKETKYGIIHDFNYQLFKNELFHIMTTYEKEYIVKREGEYIEIDEELCNEINDL